MIDRVVGNKPLPANIRQPGSSSLFFSRYTARLSPASWF
jgi:hypothetical protein